LGRGNGVYEAPRAVIESLDVDLAEVSASREKGLCCGAGGAQMFKEEEAGDKRINTKRTEQLIEVLPDIIAVACPYCTTMITDGVKGENKQDEVKVLDIAELIAQNNNY
jgi:Fe-S oxidoreductase